MHQMQFQYKNFLVLAGQRVLLVRLNIKIINILQYALTSRAMDLAWNCEVRLAQQFLHRL